MSGSIVLPRPAESGGLSVEKTLQSRRSVRHYRDAPLMLADVSQLLWAAQGITGSNGKRTAPSAGALYPLNVYLAAGSVDGIPPGVYAYDPVRHDLRGILSGDVRNNLGRAALGQSAVSSAPAVIVICAVYERTTGKYGERGIRYVHMEAGHAAQNVSLQAVSLEIGTVVIGAFHDDQVRGVLHLPDHVRPLIIMPLGKK